MSQHVVASIPWEPSLFLSSPSSATRFSLPSRPWNHGSWSFKATRAISPASTPPGTVTMVFSVEYDSSTSSPSERLFATTAQRVASPPSQQFRLRVSSEGWPEVSTILVFSNVRGEISAASVAARGRWTATEWNLRTFRVVLELLGHDPEQAKQEAYIHQLEEALGQLRVERVNDFINLSRSHEHRDVCFYFPRTKQEIWASSTVLRAASSHFDELLRPGFLEGETSTEDEHQARRSSLTLKNQSSEFDDSDDDDETVETPQESRRDDTRCKENYHEINVTFASFKTFLAVLCWCRTGTIAFAPLSSAARNSTPHSPTVASLPISALPRVSPKSVFRLADYLQLPQLRKLAFETLKSQITVDNVALELFGDVANGFSEVMEMELSFAAKHWEEVKETDSFKAVEARAHEGEGAAVWVRLAKRLRCEL